ncbi:HAD-IIIA family hydrolase [Chishuiella changwenlii]|uniref:KdsC family phosphatase n=1 Tax=Chishuiella changwenlii TaxID=1434701 RepID=UPI002FDAD032
MISYKEKLNNINTVILDVDGVLTDGNLILLPTGEMVRTMNTRDGYAMQLAIKQGIKIAVITGGRDEAVVSRLKYLGLTDIYINKRDKVDAFQDLIFSYGLNPDEIAYMGDDYPDLAVMSLVGLPCCPNDACMDVRKASEYISPENGGRGCVRDLLEQILKVQNKWYNTEEEIASV